MGALRDLGEVALDSALDDGVLKDLPLVGWAFGGARVVRQVRDRLFLKKLASFFSGLATTPLRTRQSFVNEISDDPAFRQRVGDGLVLLIERHEHFKKSSALGVAFAAYVEGAINYASFQEVATLIDRSSPADLSALAGRTEVDEPLDEAVGLGLARVGAAHAKHALVMHSNDDGTATFETHTRAEYHLTVAGRSLASLLTRHGT